MRTVGEIYDAYRIMPGLQTHQLRVAAVGKMICNRLTVAVDEASVVYACLFHDMGNIIKSDLTSFPDFLGPNGFEYWKNVKDEFVAKYGEDEHHATITIAGEIGLPGKVVALIDGVSFSNLENLRDHASLEQKIVEYADLRVAPRGITSLLERSAEAKLRYADRTQAMGRTEEEYQRLLAAAVEIEGQIFAECRITPEEITEEEGSALFAGLRALSIEATGPVSP